MLVYAIIMLKCGPTVNLEADLSTSWLVAIYFFLEGNLILEMSVPLGFMLNLSVLRFK